MRFLGQMGTIVPSLLFPLVIGFVVAVPLVNDARSVEFGIERAIAATPKATTIRELQICQIIDEMQAASNSHNLTGVMKHLTGGVGR